MELRWDWSSAVTLVLMWGHQWAQHSVAHWEQMTETNWVQHSVQSSVERLEKRTAMNLVPNLAPRWVPH